jgi:hypothetical protein
MAKTRRQGKEKERTDKSNPKRIKLTSMNMMIELKKRCCIPKKDTTLQKGRENR